MKDHNIDLHAKSVRLINSIYDSGLSESDKLLLSRQILEKSTMFVDDGATVETEIIGETLDAWMERYIDVEKDNLDIKTAMYRKYSVSVKQGKWNFRGDVDFFGSHDSGIDPVNFWADDGEGGTRPQAIRIFCSNWQDIRNAHCAIVRYHYHGGLKQWEREGTMFRGTLSEGKGSENGYDITVK